MNNDNFDEGKSSMSRKSSSSSISSSSTNHSPSHSNKSESINGSEKCLSDHHSSDDDSKGSDSDSDSSKSDVSSLYTPENKERSESKYDEDAQQMITNDSGNHSSLMQSFESKLDDFQNRMQQQEIAYMEKLESLMEQSKLAKEDQFQEKLVENQNKQIELQQQIQEHQNRLLEEQQKYQQRYDELYNLQRQIEGGKQQQLDLTNNIGGQYDPVTNNRIVVKDTETQTPRGGENNDAKQLNDSFFNLSTRFDEVDQENLKKNDHGDNDPKIGNNNGDNEYFDGNSSSSMHNRQDDPELSDRLDYNDNYQSDQDRNSSHGDDFFREQHSDIDQRMSDRPSERWSDPDSKGNRAIDADHSDDMKLGEQTEFFDANSESLRKSNRQDSEEAAALNEISRNQADVVVMDQEEPAIIVHENGRGYLICKIIRILLFIASIYIFTNVVNNCLFSSQTTK